MDFIKNFKPTPLNIAKVLGGVVVGLVVISLLAQVFGNAGPLNLNYRSMTDIVSTVSTDNALYKRGFDGETSSSPQVSGDVYEEGGYGTGGNIGIMPPRGHGSVGADAEEYEVTQYSAHIETRDKEAVCSEIEKLKSLSYVIFEDATAHEEGCTYTFKVEKENTQGILSRIEVLNPRDLSERTYTIERRVSELAGEEEILRRKLETIDDTMRTALRAYDDVTALATRTQDAESLARIIDSKLGTIERLTGQQINITAQLERLIRAKEVELDKLIYTYFYVNVHENKFINGDSLSDSWKAAVKQFVETVNGVVQSITIGVVGLLVIALQYILYLLLLIIIAKYLWRVTKYIWRK